MMKGDQAPKLGSKSVYIQIAKPTVMPAKAPIRVAPRQNTPPINTGST